MIDFYTIQFVAIYSYHVIHNFDQLNECRFQHEELWPFKVQLFIKSLGDLWEHVPKVYVEAYRTNSARMGTLMFVRLWNIILRHDTKRKPHGAGTKKALYLSSGFLNLVEIVVGGFLSPILYLRITIPTQIYTDESPIIVNCYFHFKPIWRSKNVA